jgi:hypothetical protein
VQLSFLKSKIHIVALTDFLAAKFWRHLDLKLNVKYRGHKLDEKNSIKIRCYLCKNKYSLEIFTNDVKQLLICR